MQLYLLSVVLNLVGGLALVSRAGGERLAALRKALGPVGINVTLGAGALAVGVAKLALRSPVETVAFAGDLLPGLAGIGVGAAILMDLYAARQSESESLVKLRNAAANYRMPVGIAALAAGALHFLFPAVVIL
jgi:hypothetical protein